MAHCAPARSASTPTRPIHTLPSDHTRFTQACWSLARARDMASSSRAQSARRWPNWRSRERAASTFAPLGSTDQRGWSRAHEFGGPNRCPHNYLPPHAASTGFPGSVYLPPQRAMTEDGRVERVAKALADPRRFQILETIAKCDEGGCQSLCEQFPVAQPTMSHHLKELARAGLIETWREGQFVYCRFRSDAVREYLAALDLRLGVAYA